MEAEQRYSGNTHAADEWSLRTQDRRLNTLEGKVKTQVQDIRGGVDSDRSGKVLTAGNINLEEEEMFDVSNKTGSEEQTQQKMKHQFRR